MAETTYTYSIANDTANAALNINSLNSEIAASSIITAHDHSSALGDSLKIVFKDSLSTGDETTLDSVVSAHTGAESPEDPTPVRSRSERSDISMRLCCNSGTCDSNGDVTIEFKVPGTFGSDVGREVAGGIAFWNVPTAADQITNIDVVDKDNVTGAGAGTVIKSWTDSTQSGYQKAGWYVPLNGPLQLHSLGDWGVLPAGLYLRIKAVGVPTTGSLYINIMWGEPS